MARWETEHAIIPVFRTKAARFAEGCQASKVAIRLAIFAHYCSPMRDSVPA
jgi:hypothetical protein